MGHQLLPIPQLMTPSQLSLSPGALGTPGWWDCPKYRQLAGFCSATTHLPLEVWSCFHLGPDEIEMSLEIDFQFNQKGNLFLGLSKWKVTL